MMARRGVMGVLAGGVAAVLGGCGVLGGNSYRFKLTVEVETPKGLRTGSSVYEVLAFKTSELITGGTSSDSTIKGESTIRRETYATGGPPTTARNSKSALVAFLTSTATLWRWTTSS